ncbi:sulfite exporter TauE/SafE family protein [Schaalia sp. 19OD2882]|uniref:sulfite exporter TauE/SafE family protein n=1 Tax=Schaalia sp. 19OD2882 TaxID=2794089 RepID=UPI001C1ECB39|nr:sulfite exporter TauE/SafE family protein [Schaalia sp. 19OD2882]QWW19141.1 sulfite exporter TauE/SafE family protein [Schaalia sp. 19OD2882]
MTRTPTITAAKVLVPVLVGLGAGLLSGLFGIGGGIVIVPALVAFLAMDQRRASATSLVAMIPTATVGAITYGIRGQISLTAALVLVAGTLVGTQIGVWLLRRLPERILPWTFVAFVAAVLVSSQFQVPVRDADLVLDLPRGAALVLVGVTAGTFSGLVGVGGGSIIVPGMQLLVGVGDLLARGTSLLVIIPTSITGTWTNLRHGLVDVRTGLLLGTASCFTAPVGVWIAGLVSPRVGGILFSIFLVVIMVNTILKARARERARRAAGGPEVNEPTR